MNLLIVEDEFPTAEYTEQLCREILGKELSSIHMVHDLPEALQFIENHEIDLCLLDLNLHGESGYDLLRTAAGQAFHTVIISAYPDQAIEAFQYGVIDFIVKPFGKKRLYDALQRVQQQSRNRDITTKFLSVRVNDEYKLIPIEHIVYMKAVGSYIELHLKNGRMELLLKTMNRLEQILPAYFFRMHRSYFININEIESFRHAGGGNYKLVAKGGIELPLSRSKYKELYELFNR